jgi:hypothetical protein
MSIESDLILLADCIESLQEELAQMPAGHDRIEIEALLEIAQETYKVMKARLQNAPNPSARRRNRPGQHLQWH